MAREYAAVKVAIWQDDDFRELSPSAQHLYFVILTSPRLSFCGVAEWRPKRILPLAKGWTMADLYAAASELTAAHLLVVDEETEEALVRSFLRHDGVMRHNKTCVSAMMAFTEIASNSIRGVIVHELNRLSQEFPDWPAWEREQVREVLKRRALAPELAPGLAPSAAPGLGESSPWVSPIATPAPTPAPLHLASSPSEGQPSGDEDATPRRKPERPLPDKWEPNVRHHEIAIEKRLSITDEAARFRNHAETHDRRARDWDAAFRTWLSKSTNGGATVGGKALPTYMQIGHADYDASLAALGSR